MPMPKILVVDDKMEVRICVKAILEDAGYEIDEAENGLVALNKMQDVNYNTDLIVTDIMMPELDGIEFMTALKIMDRKIPVLAISGGGHAMDANEMLNAANQVADHILTKPFTPTELLSAIRTATHNLKKAS